MTNKEQTNDTIHILLADDDKDDRYFFEKALKSLPIKTRLTTSEDGEKLMVYLSKHSDKLPDILFLDLNMPRKNGAECLTAIKSNEKFNKLPVIIYSTSLHDEVADILYKAGAHYYVRKSELNELKKLLFHVMTLMMKKNFKRPLRSEFIINLVEV